MTGKASGHIDHEAAQAGPHVNPDALEVAPGTAHEQLEGWIPQLASDEEIRIALEKAFDYRGDVTITRKEGTKIEGYLFDRRTGPTLKDSLVRLYPKNSTEKAFDYRGDVTITRKEGTKIEGYLFDRRTGPTLKDSLVRLYPKNSTEK